jgi:hypothetical protein
MTLSCFLALAAATVPLCASFLLTPVRVLAFNRRFVG